MHRDRPPPPDEVADLLAAVRAELESREWGSLDEAQAHMDAIMRRQNARPQADLGGLTPNELSQLLHGEWRGRSPLHLLPTLPLAAIEGAPWLVVARRLMRIIEEAGPIRLTPAGNLPKPVVKQLVEPVIDWAIREHWSGQGVDRVKEQDLQLIHLPRVLLEVAGLLKRRKGHLALSKAGRALLPDEQAGELLAVLFETCFRELDLAYLDRLDEAPVFQHLVGYALVRLRTVAHDWTSPDVVQKTAIHPGVRPAVPVPSPDWDPIGLMVETRLLRPLEMFNLIERRPVPRQPPAYLPDELRKTPLYDRFLTDGRRPAAAHG